MMASIPNMRSAPLPLPGGKTAPAGEAAPGDFAAQMPAVPGLAVELAALLSEAIVDPAAPVPETTATGEAGDDADSAETQAIETPRPDQPDPEASVIPFLPVQPAVPALPATVSADGTAPAQPRGTKPAAPAHQPFRPAGEAGAAETGLPRPAAAKAPKEQADAPQDPADSAAIEAAVKALLGRKQAATKQVAAGPSGRHPDAAKPDVAPTQSPAQPQKQAATPAAPTAVPASAAPTPILAQTPDQPQPVLALPAPQPAPLKAEAADGAAGTRTTELAVERQLDLARDAQWLDRLARDIARAGADDQPLRFRLHPQTLGHLHVELQQGDHGTSVRLTVETEAARQLLADAQPRLAAEARAQGVRIAETHVDLSGSGRHAPGDQRRQDEARQHPLIRTAPGAGTDAVASARSSARARLDRYA